MPRVTGWRVALARKEPMTAPSWLRPGRRAWIYGLLLVTGGALAGRPGRLDPQSQLEEVSAAALADGGQRRSYQRGQAALNLLPGRGWTLVLHVGWAPRFVPTRYLVLARVDGRLELEQMRSAGVEGTTTLVGAAIGDYLLRTGLDLGPVDACFAELFPQESVR